MQDAWWWGAKRRRGVFIRKIRGGGHLLGEAQGVYGGDTNPFSDACSDRDWFWTCTAGIKTTPKRSSGVFVPNTQD